MTVGGKKRLPEDGQRCTAVNRAGERCSQWLVKGTTKCRFHGSGGNRNNRGRPITHGAHSMRLRAVATQDEADRIQELTEDPALLDLARTIATSQWIIEQHMPSFTDEAIYEFWKRKHPALTLYADGEIVQAEPTAGELLELKVTLVQQAIRALSLHGDLQVKARKTLAMEQVIKVLVMPILTRLGAEFMEVVAQCVAPDELELVRAGLELKRKRAIVDVHTVLLEAK